MKLIVGLGNPGKNYEKTRHNAGFLALDRVIQRHAPAAPARARFSAAVVEAKIGSEVCLFMKPTMFMNRSGGPVGEASNFYKLDPSRDVLVLVDDMALPCGQIRLKPGGGSGGHNGLEDIQRALGADTYPRLRIGIDPKPPFMDDQADYVLGRFSDEQWALVEPAFHRSADAVEVFATKGLDAAMNQFNAEPRPPRPKKPRPEGAGDTGTPPVTSSRATNPQNQSEPNPKHPLHEPPGREPGPSTGKVQGL
jgi:peptidyl-tRNA hydrolase, PTH1 family